MNLISNKKSITALTILTSISCLGLLQHADAAVTWLASDDGTNLTLTTDGGSIAFSGTSISLQPGNPSEYLSDSSHVFTGPTASNSNEIIGGGVVSSNDPWIVGTTSASSTTGINWGFVGAVLSLPTSVTTATGTYTPISSSTFAGLTVATAFGTNLDAGPVVLWTANGTGDTISVARAVAVPEPSSSILTALGVTGFLLQRRRKRD